ncbi:MAG: polyprenyl synthetase family protein [Planctomycetota bacterium]|nr:MAG: polyprenyl synthetase family protein [Planctomycetota bacterium]
MQTASFADWLAAARPEVEVALAAALQRRSAAAAPPALREAMQRALLAGGKRLRPALSLLACEASGGVRGRALAGALAAEMIHAYSLVHDDLPCMDDDQLRRGLPTLHVIYGEALAVLAGDALQALAFETLAAQEDARLAREQAALLSAAAGAAGMVGGQVLDLQAEGARCRAGDVEAIHARKTAALLCAALQMGAAAAGVDPKPWEAFGGALGRLFQATDDLLDATASREQLGKNPRRDQALEKATLVAALGLDGTRRRAAELAEEAHKALLELPLRRHRQVLRDVPAFLLQRAP